MRCQNVFFNGIKIPWSKSKFYNMRMLEFFLHKIYWPYFVYSLVIKNPRKNWQYIPIFFPLDICELPVLFEGYDLKIRFSSLTTLTLFTKSTFLNQNANCKICFNCHKNAKNHKTNQSKFLDYYCCNDSSFANSSSNCEDHLDGHIFVKNGVKYHHSSVIPIH